MRGAECVSRRTEVVSTVHVSASSSLKGSQQGGSDGETSLFYGIHMYTCIYFLLHTHIYHHTCERIHHHSTNKGFYLSPSGIQIQLAGHIPDAFYLLHPSSTYHFERGPIDS